MKGIILAGGAGTRLYPITQVVCKQLLPVYDKPMIYYPLSTLMMAGIRDILIISTPKDTPIIESVLGDGQKFGISLSYVIQDNPNGIAESFILGKDFIGNDSCALILGDNIFYGHGLTELLQNAIAKNDGATIFGYRVKDPQRYGVVELDNYGLALSLEEKPKKPKSNMAVVGLYIYDNNVISIAENLTPSARGELEITDLNIEYIKRKKLRVAQMGRGYAWLDTGTTQSLLDASIFVKIIEERKGLKIACLEEIAYMLGYISKEFLLESIEKFSNSTYGEYIKNISNGE